RIHVPLPLRRERADRTNGSSWHSRILRRNTAAWRPELPGPPAWSHCGRDKRASCLIFHSRAEETPRFFIQNLSRISSAHGTVKGTRVPWYGIATRARILD